jgi:exonuclease I
VAAGQPPDQQERTAGLGPAHDPSELRDLDADTLRLRLFTRTADLPEGEWCACR